MRSIVNVDEGKLPRTEGSHCEMLPPFSHAWATEAEAGWAGGREREEAEKVAERGQAL